MLQQDNSEKVSEAFSKQSVVFDELDKQNPLSKHLRNIFREEVMSHLKPGSSILELNCGTGLDAIYFASLGHHVLATDNAPGMIAALQDKVDRLGLTDAVSCQRLNYHDLSRLAPQKFDFIVSNFGGLNCTPDLEDVLNQLAPLLNEGGKVTLVIMPKICPWELAMVLKGKLRTAFRRFKKKTSANVEGVSFDCYYYNPSYVISRVKDTFHVRGLKGIFITVPPEFYQNFVERYPLLYRILSRTDNIIGRVFPFNRCCDHFMITLQKR